MSCKGTRESTKSQDRAMWASRVPQRAEGATCNNGRAAWNAGAEQHAKRATKQQAKRATKQ
eukprot:3836952-Ditylum_brightwellii.AAC.1